MLQNKLTSQQLLQVQAAIDGIGDMCHWADTADGEKYWEQVTAKLDAMLTHGTSDGKPHLPRLPMNHRFATKADVGRIDAHMYYMPSQSWVRAGYVSLTEANLSGNLIFCVPNDVIPEDKDCRTAEGNRLKVMVEHHGNDAWVPRYLIAVLARSSGKYLVTSSDDDYISSHDRCRLPYLHEYSLFV